MALAAYRHLLRATRIAFVGDVNLLHASRLQTRVGFNEKRSLEPSSAEATKAIEHAEGVASVLRHNIVQGVAEPGSDKYHLRIHEDTERGDNDTIKNPLVPGGKVKIGGA